MLNTKPRFDTEAWKNSEMAYLSWVNYVSYWRRWSKMGGELVIGGS